MKRWEKILVSCGVAAVAVEVILILVYRIPIYFPYKIDWAVFLKKMFESGMLPFH